MTRPDRQRSVGSGLRRVADYAGFVFVWGWILVSLLFVPAMLGAPFVGIALFLVGLVVCWQAAEASSDPVYTFGTMREVRTGHVDSATVDCGECGRPAEGGEYRRYEERRVLFGTTIAVPEAGENVYCEACAVDPRDPFESGRDGERDPTTAGDPTARESPDSAPSSDLESERS
ncbi:hypothetical protein [Natrinema longum]|uniref:DUF8108 domain-containing protein n=1 Tax=Natrinema longum TaxID=370324 RepID=A0A8A2U8Z4_9EURY|nr:hypothetical protein [Natrinema longum]MBZ6493483.1 hypothetical protein [Natrinema longum]QSW85170.1 hypothetical protein J0X27_17275 [Natrinema longum]